MAEMVLSTVDNVPAHMEQRTQEAFQVLLDMAEILVQVSSKTGGSEQQEEASAAREVALRLLELLRKMLDCSRAIVVTIDPDTEELSLLAATGSFADQEQQ